MASIVLLNGLDGTSLMGRRGLTENFLWALLLSFLCVCWLSGCGVNEGGLTIWPGGVPGERVGAEGVTGCVTRPVNACWRSGASRSARVFCR